MSNQRKISDNLEFIAVDKIYVMPENARTHPEEQIIDIRNSIRQFGITQPLLIDEKNVLIAGEGRLIGSKLEGLEKVPCRRYSGLNEAEKLALSVIDNKLGLKAGWDAEKLQNIIDKVANQFSAQELGFTDEEVQRLQDDLTQLALKTLVDLESPEEKTTVTEHQRLLPSGEEYLTFSLSLPAEQRDFVIFFLKKYASENSLNNTSEALYQLCKERMDAATK